MDTRSALLRRLYAHPGFTAVDAATHDAFVSSPEACVLFFAGDPRQHRETNDVAVVLPELVSAFSHRFRVGLITPDAEQALQRRYGFAAWPSLVFVRGGGYLGVITGMRDWGDYLRAVERLLSAEPGPPPVSQVAVTPEGRGR
jgi:hydrogenase-1 operon protein HyaE